MTEPSDPNESGQQEPAGASPRAQRRRDLLRFGTAVPMVLTLRPGSTLAASHGCARAQADDPDAKENGLAGSGEDSSNSAYQQTEASVGCASSVALDLGGGRDASERPTMLAGRTGSSYAKFWLDRA